MGEIASVGKISKYLQSFIYKTTFNILCGIYISTHFIMYNPNNKKPMCVVTCIIKYSFDERNKDFIFNPKKKEMAYNETDFC